MVSHSTTEWKFFFILQGQKGEHHNLSNQMQLTKYAQFTVCFLKNKHILITRTILYGTYTTLFSSDEMKKFWQNLASYQDLNMTHYILCTNEILGSLKLSFGFFLCKCFIFTDIYKWNASTIINLAEMSHSGLQIQLSHVSKQVYLQEMIKIKLSNNVIEY